MFFRFAALAFLLLGDQSLGGDSRDRANNFAVRYVMGNEVRIAAMKRIH